MGLFDIKFLALARHWQAASAALYYYMIGHWLDCRGHGHDQAATDSDSKPGTTNG